MQTHCRTAAAIVLSILLSIGVLACGGGGGGGPQDATISGTVSGTVILAVDETGAIVAKDDTTGKAPVDNTLPARYPFSLAVASGHSYTFYFVVGEGTPTERIVSLYDAPGTSNVFTVAAGGTVDLGFVDTSLEKGSAENDPGQAAGETGPRSVRVAGDNGVLGYRYFNLIDHSDGTRRYRAQVQVYDAGGTTLADGTRIRAMTVYDNTWQALAADGTLLFWNGSGASVDSIGTVAPFPMADVEQYLTAAPGSLSPGFYTVAVTDDNRNLYTSKVYLGAPVQVAKPTGLVSAANSDSSVTLSWTNPPALAPENYLVYLHLISDDRNQDGYLDSDPLLFVIRGLPTNTYTIPAEYVQGTLSGKPGLRWMVQIRQRTPAPIEYPDGLVAEAQFYRTYSSEALLNMPESPSPLALAGTWDFVELRSGGNAGWARGTVSIDATGNVTFPSFLDSAGGTIPPAGPIVASLDASGAVSQTVGGVSTGFHGNLSAAGDLIVATESADAGTSLLHLARKRTTTTFSSADIASKAFVFHNLQSGAVTTWEYGGGSTDASGTFTITSYETPLGTFPGLPLVDIDILSVNSVGVVSSLDPTLGGFMTNDKQVVIVTNSFDVGGHTLLVIFLTGQTFAQADLAGEYDFHSLRNAPVPAWGHGTFSVDASGAATYLSYADSVGGPTPGGFVRTISAAGVISDTADATFHGQMSFNKDIYVKTNTNASGSSGIALAVR